MDKTIAIASPPFNPPHHMMCLSLALTLGKSNTFTVAGTKPYTPTARAINTSIIARKIVPACVKSRETSTDNPTNKNKSELQTKAKTSHVSSTVSFSLLGIRLTPRRPNVMAEETTAITPETCIICSEIAKLLYAKTIDIIRYALIFARTRRSNSQTIIPTAMPTNNPPKNTLENSAIAI